MPYEDGDNGDDIGGWFAEWDYQAEQDEKEEEAVRRRAIRKARMCRLPKAFVITCISPYTKETLYYQDRSVSKERFWTKYLSDAFLFQSEAAARSYCRRLKYNHPNVKCVRKEEIEAAWKR